MISNNLKLGLGQLLVEGGEPARNLERAEELIIEASLNNCEMILLPECMDLAWTHPSCLLESEPIPGKYSDQISQLAKKYEIYICCGLTERHGKNIYNTAVLIDDQGQILLKYRKINILDIALTMYSPGQDLSVVDTKFGKIGVNICSDNYSDALDIGFVLARMGAQLILSPSSWTVDFTIDETKDPYGEKWLSPYQSLADLFNIVVVGATSVGTIVGGPYEGKKMIGCSLAVGPKKIIVKSDFNEFSSELISVNIEIPEPQLRGTEIGLMLKDKEADAGPR
jgi:predicted amidohydrolase